MTNEQATMTNAAMVRGLFLIGHWDLVIGHLPTSIA
jgi:hypothetical protein